MTSNSRTKRKALCYDLHSIICGSRLEKVALNQT